ncbi:polysaccharide biosynthesis/export family protein [Enterovirga aerilata]|uniref:Polysaccharide export protein n=1 Tax=Enterovirga aerilata TaxID=2730920 RepID=A0A849I3S3_9HYPH|nr:polysaccharide biosynthesis/export family protein [Enterovirga sp. DB1703]NNM74072.1 polysaccharide export protein [Enterovirga sp. DB1703]
MATDQPSRQATRSPVLRTLRAAAIAAMICCAGAGRAEAQSLQIGPGDRLAVTVFGQPEMSGEFLVGDDGMIVFPLIGEVAVADATLGEIQKRFVEQLKDGFIVNPAVTVRIVELRPVYVVGDVRAPGSYPFRFGASVMSAVALAGGFGAQDQPAAAARTELILADERVRVLEGKLGALVLKLARLHAQRDDAPFDPPRPDGMTPTEYLPALERERGALTADSRALAQELALLRQQKPRIEAEKQALEVQRQSEQVQLNLIREHISGFTQLMAQGYARRYTGIELQREEARNTGNIARLNADMARLDLALIETELRIQTATNTYRRRILAEVEDTMAKIAEIRASLPSAREILAARLQQSGSIADRADQKRSIAIIRRHKGETFTTAAQGTTPVRPGDIVEVRIEPANAEVRGIGPITMRDSVPPPP